MADQLRPLPLGAEADLDADVPASPAQAEAPHPAIERLLAYQEQAQGLPSSEAQARLLTPGLHVGTVVAVAARTASVSVDGMLHEVTLPDHVDPDFLRLAMVRGEFVLLQTKASGASIALGVVQGNHPSKLVGERVEVVGSSEVVVRSGKSALRLRADGVVDLIGARISASSRGLLRLVGRALRLN